MDFAYWLDAELKKRGLTHNAFARLSGLAQSAISNVIAGKRKPGAAFCIKVALALDLPPVGLLKLAGIIPGDASEEATITVEDDTLQAIVDAARQLPPKQRADVLQYIRFLLSQG